MRCDACGQLLPETGQAIETDTLPIGKRHPETAQRMKAKALPRSGSDRRRFVDWLATQRDGATDYEAADALGRSHQSTSACRNSLVRDGWVRPLVKNGEIVTRPNEFGNECMVWWAGPPPGLVPSNEELLYPTTLFDPEPPARASRFAT